MADTSEATTSEGGLGPATLLVVDDHQAIREGLRSALEGVGDLGIVGEASDKREALRLLVEAAPDIAILDLSLPGVSGVDLVREIRQRSSRTRIVVYTMHAEPALLSAMREAGVDGYVLKGEPLRVLMDTLRTVRRGERRFPETAAAPIPMNPEQPPLEPSGAPAAPSDSDPISTLSRREREVFLRLAQGQSVKQTAFELAISPKTIETYKYRLMRKLGVQNVVELARLAIRRRLVSP